MGELTHSTPTPSIYRTAGDTESDQKGTLLRPMFDGELWNDLACTVYDLRDPTVYPILSTTSIHYILPFEMPVDGRVELPHYVQIIRLGDGPVAISTQFAVVKRGATPVAADWIAAEGMFFTVAGIFIFFLGTTLSRLPMAGSGSTDVPAGKWDLWIEYLNSSVDDASLELFYVSLRRGRKPTA